MMQRVISVAFIAAILCLPASTRALVDPKVSSLPLQPWFAQIYVDDGSPVPKEFCKGALIAQQWVLTTGYCIYDPFEALGADRNGAGAKYVIKFAGSTRYYNVEKFVQSDDLAAGLMKLAEPVELQPVKVSSSMEAELRNKEVRILGTERTLAIGDAFYNPNLGKRMYCRVDGSVYFREGALCYVMSRSSRSSTLLQSRATVIDPAASGAPNTQLDRAAPFDMSGKRLYLDFRLDNSYPCHEDLGAPVVRVDANGGVEVVGIVSSVGMVQFPMCSPTLQNRFGAAAAYQDFMDTTMAQDAFDDICPATPVLKADYPGGLRVRVSWNAVAGASGYRLMYTSNPGYTPFTSLDMGNSTEVSTDLNPAFVYGAVIVAYNEVCTSPPSGELAISL